MKVKPITIFENILGVILAIFIIFKWLPSVDVCKQMNNPIFIILALVFIVLLFLTLNPIIGILFLIYFYQIVIKGKDQTQRQMNEMKSMNPEKETQLEEIVIQNSNFARIKNQNEDKETRVTPLLEKFVC
jgi:hypothetical protein